MPKSFDLSARRVITPLFNTARNLEYVEPHLEPKYYGADYMSGDGRAQFLEWYQEQKQNFSH
jgi:hypothetical protein